MRCVDKGVNPTPYKKYRDAVTYLVGRIGCYCSYCEMVITNEPDVEHVQPITKGGAAFLLENFLLACKKCNKIKSNKNPTRTDHLWPDEDNTFIAFEYQNEIFVRPHSSLPSSIKPYAENILKLTGIDRVPKKLINPSKKDKKDLRWQGRKIAWGKAERALNNWAKNQTPELCDQIAETAHSTGFYSIWVKFFSGTPAVLAAIKAKFPNTYDPLPNGTGGYQLRTMGRF